jgi:hypothetical protein
MLAVAPTSGMLRPCQAIPWTAPSTTARLVRVEPDPLRARATDSLGLQAAADRLADRLLPGLSVLTTRARYFTFLTWARDVGGREYQERNIHRLEVALALVEASLSERDADHAEACRFVGRETSRAARSPSTVSRLIRGVSACWPETLHGRVAPASFNPVKREYYGRAARNAYVVRSLSPVRMRGG